MTEYNDVVADVIPEMSHQLYSLEEAGVADIIIDPRRGFAKTLDQNYRLLAHLDDFKILGRPILCRYVARNQCSLTAARHRSRRCPCRHGNCRRSAIDGARRYYAYTTPRSCTDNIHSGEIIAKHLTIPYDARLRYQRRYRHTGFRSTALLHLPVMKESGTINIFYGVLAFIVVWILASEIFDMRLIGTILDKFMAIGLIILVILLSRAYQALSLSSLAVNGAGASRANYSTTTKEEIDNKAPRLGHAYRIRLHEHEQKQDRRTHRSRAIRPARQLRRVGRPH